MPDLGSWPDWIAANVAFLALVVAVVAAYATVRTNRAQQTALSLQQQQIAALENREKREQAEKVSAWIDPELHGGAKYRISNQSGQPVSNFIIWHIDDSNRGYPMCVWVVPPGEFVMDLHVEWAPPPEPITMTFGMPVTYMFRDIHQQGWRREQDGLLTRLEEFEIPVPTRTASIATYQE